MKPIVICATPRTGSNLLTDSLAQHPNAVSGGEWFNWDVEDWVLRNRELRPTKCNIFKLMPFDAHRDEWLEIVRAGFVVHLWRRNRSAQLRSWQKACVSGKWLEEDPEGSKFDFPSNAREIILDANQKYALLADFSLTYEAMIEDWDGSVSQILEQAGWSPRRLPMAREKLSDP